MKTSNPSSHSAEALRVGIIGFDTSHVPAFTQLLNDVSHEFYVPGARVVAGYPSFSPDLGASASRVEGFIQEMRDRDVEIVDSLEALIENVDAVLLESVDGRRHLSEATPVIQAGKPLFIDKPLAHNFEDARAIVRMAEQYRCPLFSSSSLRYDANIVTLANDEELGPVLACDAFSPAQLDASNPGLFWYGIHGVELLYTFMGTGCQSVRCESTDIYDIVTATWPDGRLATFRGTRGGSHDYGVTVFGEQGVRQTRFSREIPLYSQLLKKIVPFFQTGQPPLPSSETLEIMAFMQAALISQRENRPVSLAEVA